MKVDCNNCRARYRLDEAMFKGSKGIQVRCRSCGNSMIVLNPGVIISEMSVLNQVTASRDRSDKRRIDPAVSLARREHSPPPEVGRTTPVEEEARISKENRTPKPMKNGSMTLARGTGKLVDFDRGKVECQVCKDVWYPSTRPDGWFYQDAFQCSFGCAESESTAKNVERIPEDRINFLGKGFRLITGSSDA